VKIKVKAVQIRGEGALNGFHQQLAHALMCFTLFNRLNMCLFYGWACLASCFH